MWIPHLVSSGISKYRVFSYPRCHLILIAPFRKFRVGTITITSQMGKCRWWELKEASGYCCPWDTMGLHFYTLYWTLESGKLKSKNVCLSSTGLTPQVWVVQALPVSKKGLALDWLLGANSKPREYPAQSEYFYLRGHTRVYATVWVRVEPGPCCSILEKLESE